MDLAGICTFDLIISYFIIKTRKQLLIEKVKTVEQAKKWKNVLKILSDCVIIWSHNKIIYFNAALKEAFHLDSGKDTEEDKVSNNT
jgi:hypothetical protein